MRAFVALALPEPILAALVSVQSALPGRPMPEDNLHLTLAFLGEVDEMTLDEVGGALGMARLPGVEIRVTGLTTFGGRVPRLVAAEVARTPPLAELRRKVVTAARAAGCALPRERFRPHVTLTRFRQAGPDAAQAARLDRALMTHAGLTLPPEAATSVTLTASTLSPEGSRHDHLARFALPAPGP